MNAAGMAASLSLLGRQNALNAGFAECVPNSGVGRVPVLRWRDRMTGVGHIAAIPDLAVSFTRQTRRPVTCDGHP